MKRAWNVLTDDYIRATKKKNLHYQKKKQDECDNVSFNIKIE